MSHVEKAKTFGRLHLWLDKEARLGVENMAIDQLLLEQIGDVPLLRVYGWSQPTVSFGYFTELAAAKASFSGDGLDYVRRWTGGGIVDHRGDLTYTLVIPKNHQLAQSRGDYSYQVIHRALAEVLNCLGESVHLSESLQKPIESGAACFDHPVPFDIIGASAEKVAGAGQRRTKHGLLHQGSTSVLAEQSLFAGRLAECLASEVTAWLPFSSLGLEIKGLVMSRYATPEWLTKR